MQPLVLYAVDFWRMQQGNAQQGKTKCEPIDAQLQLKEKSNNSSSFSSYRELLAFL